ncbi:transposase [Streptomyces eurythermus]|uniref:transposase n=1 Tax=Streptomyces eurythermus TaxID=42237 RepID=UPI003703124D
MGADRAVAPGPDAEAGWAPAGPREVIGAIAYKFRTGTQWARLPERHGNWRGVCDRLRMWARRRHVGAGVHRSGGSGRRGGRRQPGRVRGLRHRARSPARCRGPRKGARPASRTITPSAGLAADGPRGSTSRPTAGAGR